MTARTIGRRNSSSATALISLVVRFFGSWFDIQLVVSCSQLLTMTSSLRNLRTPPFGTRRRYRPDVRRRSESKRYHPRFPKWLARPGTSVSSLVDNENGFVPNLLSPSLMYGSMDLMALRKAETRSACWKANDRKSMAICPLDNHFRYRAACRDEAFTSIMASF
jgi:hypothetical protein